MRANICAALNFGLFDGDGTHLFLVIEFGEDGAHAVATQAAGVNRALDIKLERITPHKQCLPYLAICQYYM